MNRTRSRVMDPKIVQELESAIWQEGDPLPARQRTPKRRCTKRKTAFVWTLPYGSLSVAAQLPGKAVVVWILAHHQSKLDDTTIVTIPTRRLTECGIDRDSYLRARGHLERAGLIVVRPQGRGQRHASIIELVTLPEDEPAPIEEAD